jgi:alpha-L-rhamnosidase
VVATAYYARSAELLGQIAAVLGRAEDATRYLRLAAEVRDAFDAEYVTPAGRVLSDSETAYALALQFGLLQDAKQRRHAGERLAALVRNSGYHISTGYVGTPLICDALCSVGEYDTTFHLLKQQGCPAWLYPVTMGATTIWERWDSLRPDGSVNPNSMTSFNHYALGAIADWLHRTVAGLAPAAPAYSHITIRPYPGGGLTRARARHITPYGLAESRWAIEGEQIEVEVVVPPNATASVALPGSDAQSIEVGAGTHRWSYPYHFERVLQPLSLDNMISEFIDDPEAWTTVLTTMRQHMPQLSSHLDVGSIMQRDRSMTLGETLSLLPHARQLRAALEDALAKLGR